MKELVKGKVALVTGGGAGIGEAAALALARNGAKVVLCDVDVDGGGDTVQQIEAAGGEAVFVKADVSSARDVEALVVSAVDRFGALHCAVNNAGIQGKVDSTDQCSEENWNRIVAINLTGVWHCMKYEIQQMKRGGAGAIVNIASNFGLVGSPGMPAYSAAKHGVLGLTKTAALENAKLGVRVNAVCPGPVQTPLVDQMLLAQPETAAEIMESITSRLPLGRIGRAEEVASAVVWLCSDQASFVTGVAMPVDGGYTTQ